MNWRNLDYHVYVPSYMPVLELDVYVYALGDVTVIRELVQLVKAEKGRIVISAVE